MLYHRHNLQQDKTMYIDLVFCSFKVNMVYLFTLSLQSPPITIAHSHDCQIWMTLINILHHRSHDTSHDQNWPLGARLWETPEIDVICCCCCQVVADLSIWSHFKNFRVPENERKTYCYKYILSFIFYQLQQKKELTFYTLQEIKMKLKKTWSYNDWIKRVLKAYISQTAVIICGIPGYQHKVQDVPHTLFTLSQL